MHSGRAQGLQGACRARTLAVRLGGAAGVVGGLAAGAGEAEGRVGGRVVGANRAGRALHTPRHTASLMYRERRPGAPQGNGESIQIMGSR